MEQVLLLQQLHKSNLGLWQEVGNNWCMAMAGRVKESGCGHGNEQCRCQGDDIFGDVMDSQSVCVGPQYKGYLKQLSVLIPKHS